MRNAKQRILDLIDYIKEKISDSSGKATALVTIQSMLDALTDMEEERDALAERVEAMSDQRVHEKKEQERLRCAVFRLETQLAEAQKRVEELEEGHDQLMEIRNREVSRRAEEDRQKDAQIAHYRNALERAKSRMTRPARIGSPSELEIINAALEQPIPSGAAIMLAALKVAESVKVIQVVESGYGARKIHSADPMACEEFQAACVGGE